MTKKTKTKRSTYTDMTSEALLINSLGAVLIALAVVMPAIMLLRCRMIVATSMDNSHYNGPLDDESERL